jgi:DNA-binding LytR/AlgR family response regulator
VAPAISSCRSSNTATTARPAAAAGPAAGLGCLVVGGARQPSDDLVRLLRGHPAVGHVTTCRDAAGALRILPAAAVDLAFIELHMPGMDGTDLAGVLNRFRTAPAVVFTADGSDGPEQAAAAWHLGAVDYLTRPVHPARLDQSVRRVLALRRPTGPVPGRRPATTGTIRLGTANEELIPVCAAGTTRLVRRSSVRWAQARRDYVDLHTWDGTYLIRARMAALAEDWAAAGLVRIHRSYLVRLEAIDGVHRSESGHLQVTIDGQSLPVSRRLVPDVWRALPNSAT